MKTAYPETSDKTVLCTDMDGTLLRSDSLLESFFVSLRREPLALLLALPLLFKSRAAFKARLSHLLLPDIDTLPLYQPLLQWLKEKRASGCSLALVTAADRKIAEAIAVRVGIFDTVLASDGVRNLKAANKAAVLVDRFGAGEFDYIGNSAADLAVWKRSRQAIVVGNRRLVQKAEKIAQVTKVFPKEEKLFFTILRAIRLYQWPKNLLVFLPLLAAHQFFDISLLLRAALAFLLFGLTASAAYLLNDLLDLASDRQHPQKRKRPFACGDLSLLWGIVLIPGLLLTAALLSISLLSFSFDVVLAGYFIITVTYSFQLKRKPLIDVMTLTGLYTIRIFTGGIAVSILPSFWLCAFSIFFFFSLALVKRYTELLAVNERGELTAQGRGWKVKDLSLVGILGTSSGIASVLVLALYINSIAAQVLYATEEILWLICPLLLYWISHLWMKTYDGAVHDDPLVFVLSDRTSQALALLFILIAVLSKFIQL